MRTRIRAAVVSTMLGVCVLSAAPAAASTLKVTSFPSGARVSVDGVNTGKLTPMNVALADGDHVVTVDIPGSGWSADTRVVTVTPGNNDLSVTLLPALTVGSAGPTGPQGPAGAAATVRSAVAGECQTGGIVVTSGDGSVSLPVCNGARGATGAQGVQGIQGVEGPPGPVGSAPVVDPRTLTRFARNLKVFIGGTPGSFGISPLSVDIDRVETFINGQVRYSPGTIRLEPFAIAAQESQGRQALETWFQDTRDRGPNPTRDVTVQLLDRTGQNILFTAVLTPCRATAVDSAFETSTLTHEAVTVTRAIVECVHGHVSAMDLNGGEEPLNVPLSVGAAPLALTLVDGGQVIADFSGGGERQGAIEAIRLRTGTFIADWFGTALNVEGLRNWFRASLEVTNGSKFRDFHVVALQPDASVSTLALFGDVFLTSIVLIDPTRTLPENGLIQVLFTLVMQPNSRQ
jgi:PEGA domain